MAEPIVSVKPDAKTHTSWKAESYGLYDEPIVIYPLQVEKLLYGLFALEELAHQKTELNEGEGYILSLIHSELFELVVEEITKQTVTAEAEDLKNLGVSNG